jgi:hypothetical protein
MKDLGRKRYYYRRTYWGNRDEPKVTIDSSVFESELEFLRTLARWQGLTSNELWTYTAVTPDTNGNV